MLINIEAHTVKNKLVWQIRRIYFNEMSKYKVSVSNFFCRVAVAPATFENNSLVYLKSNIIDLDTVNTRREILFFRFDNRNRNQFVKILIPECHNLELYELENANFSVRDFITEKIIPISSALLQLKISKI